MALTLSNIKKSSGRKRKGKRLGRGDSSGKGTYSGKGLKGQKSRAGVSRLRLKRLGLKHDLLKTPKSRGFRSLKAKNQVVNISQINRFFKNQEIISPETLWEKKLIGRKDIPVKVLGKDAIIPQDLKFERVLLSASVKNQIEKNKK